MNDVPQEATPQATAPENSQPAEDQTPQAGVQTEPTPEPTPANGELKEPGAITGADESIPGN